MKEPTIKQFKAWARKNRSIAETVLLATAFAQCERERVAAYITPIFTRYEFRDEDNGAILTDERRAFLAGDDPRFPAYYAECDRAHREHGFDGPDGYCPALVAESLQREAEQVLLDVLGELMGIDGSDYNRTLEMRAKALELALGACMQGSGKTADEIIRGRVA